jgi:DNA-binding transcriptional LysR family regulator
MPFRPGQLRYFVTVADEGQVTRAARKLEIAQPALSQAIAQLEAELGLQLLERHARGVTLTAAGEVFLPKARAAVESERDVEWAGQSLSRITEGTLDVGFVGPPPTINSPELFDAFARAYPEIEIAFRDLPFPRGTTSSWLGTADVAFCHRPAAEPGIGMQAVRPEPRAVVAHKDHPLAGRPEVSVEEVLDETFISYHPEVQPKWSGFHSLDDHRGGPPRSTTTDHAATSLQMLGIMSTQRAITTVPACDAQVAQRVLPDLVCIPLRHADPAVLSLVWSEDHSPPLVHALVATACDLAPARGRPLGPAGRMDGEAGKSPR